MADQADQEEILERNDEIRDRQPDHPTRPSMPNFLQSLIERLALGDPSFLSHLRQGNNVLNLLQEIWNGIKEIVSLENDRLAVGQTS